ncbi:hypothetical protein Fot_34362 [Forsythia ovata]|uniref:Ribosomal protein S14 n=1 Tax=Forsythia ovata TaxID=205694 RepID=A0ABD1SLE6_9LAMI
MQATLIERELIGRQVDTRIRRKNPSSLYDKWKGRLTQTAHIHISLLAIKKTSTRFRYVQDVFNSNVARRLQRLAKHSHCRRVIPKFWRSSPPSLPRNCEAHGSRRHRKPCEALILYVSTWDTCWRYRHAVMTAQLSRRGGVVDDIPHPPPVPYAASVPGVTVLQISKIMVGSSSFTFPAPGVTSGVSSDSFPARHVPSLKNSRQSGKRKTDANSKEEAF